MAFFRHRYRVFRGQPWSLTAAFTAVVSASALGGALLAVMNGWLFAKPGVPNADELVRLVVTGVERSRSARPFTYLEFKAIRQATGGQSVTGMLSTGRYVAPNISTARRLVAAGYVTGDFFQTVGGKAAVGRLLGPYDETETVGTAVLSHDLWVRMFDASPSIVGSPIQVDGRPYHVVGVLDEDFTGPFKTSPVALWLNIGSFAQDSKSLDSSRPIVFGLAPSPASRERLSRLSEAALHQLRGAEASYAAVGLWPLDDLSPDFRQRVALPAVMVLVTALVAVGAFNLASCMILMASARHREVAIRLALGAAPRAIAREMLLDAFAISFAALGVAVLLVPFLAELLAGAVEVPFGVRINPDFRSYSVMTVASLATAIVAGVASLRHIRSQRVREHLQSDESRTGRLASKDYFHRTVIGAQVCLSVLLVVVSGLWMKAAHNAGTTPIGFDADQILYTRSAGIADGWTPPIAAQYWSAAQQQLEQIPFVSRTALAEYVFGTSREHTSVTSASIIVNRVAVNRTSADYFDVMGLRLVAGRAYTKDEVDAGAPTAVVSESVARSIWGSPAAAIGASLLDTSEKRRRVVVGVVADALAHGLFELSKPVGLLFIPMPESYLPRAAVLVRVKGDALKALGELQAAMPLFRGVGQPRFTPLGETVRNQIKVARIPSRIASLAAVFTLIFTVIGLEELAALTVRQRLWEIAVRMALGASRWTVAEWVMRTVAVPVGVGAVLGLILAIGVVRSLSGVLFGISSMDFLSLTVSASLLLVAIGVGLTRPLVEACRLSPAEVLRM